MESNEKQTLYIPQGLKTQVEIFDGFGKEELFKTIIITLIAALVDGVIYLITKNIAIAVVFILTAIAGSVMMLTKDKTNISVVDQIGFMIKFFRSQKKYKYKYLDEWK
jgi:hypothetical protein